MNKNTNSKKESNKTSGQDKNKATSGGGKDTNSGGRPAKKGTAGGKGNTTGSKGTGGKG